MSIKAMNWAWEQRLPPNSKLILMALADSADEIGKCWPRVRLIAEKCCASERTVQRVLKELEERGFLHIERRFRGDGGQSSNAYYLCLESPPVNLSPPYPPPSDILAPGGDAAVTPPVPTDAELVFLTPKAAAAKPPFSTTPAGRRGRRADCKWMARTANSGTTPEGNGQLKVTLAQQGLAARCTANPCLHLFGCPWP